MSAGLERTAHQEQQGDLSESGQVSLTTLVEFTGNGATNKGSWPNGLILASDGYIYGTTERGGANNYGTVFKMAPAGALMTLVEFAGNAPANSSGFPTAPLVEGRDGNFYGTTSGGGVDPTGANNLDNGSIFKLSPAGVLNTLVRFSGNGATNKGATPYAGLVQGPNQEFYGTTFAGGSRMGVPIPGFKGFGTIYKISPVGQLITLYDFSAHIAKGQGGSPWGGLIIGKDGNFYGTAWSGLGVAGTIFKLTPNGATTTLVKFSGPKPPNKGGGCVAELMQANDGNFYGTTPGGGSGNRGTVFKMRPGGAFITLVEFANDDPRGVDPHAALVEGNDGNLYGTATGGGAHGWGTIFQVAPGGACKVVWNFSNPNATARRGITGPLLKDKEGNFYGTTKWGGKDDIGTVFKLTLHNSGAQGGTGPATSSAMASPRTPRATQAVSPEQRDFEAAKQEYEQSPHDETARLTYVTKLAQIADPLVAEYRQSGRRHDEVITVINSEWKKHPAPRGIDSKKLRQLLVGKWDSPRRTYVFRADGKCGAEDGPISGNWRIDGNQLIQGDSSGTIILLNDDYFIYAGDHDAVFFHTRVKE